MNNAQQPQGRRSNGICVGLALWGGGKGGKDIESPFEENWST